MVDAPGETRIPFGFRALDSRFEGMPPGSAVFLTGEPDAGGDAYAHTSAAMLMLSRYHPQAFERRTRAEIDAPRHFRTASSTSH